MLGGVAALMCLCLCLFLRRRANLSWRTATGGGGERREVLLSAVLAGERDPATVSGYLLLVDGE